MATRFTSPITQYVNDDASNTGSGWKLNFYSTGTLVRKDTFSDTALTTANANPVVADSSGRFTDIFLEAGTYKVVLTDDVDVEKWTADPVEGSVGTSGAVDAKTTSYTIVVDDSTKFISVDATSGSLTVTLLASATAGNGFEVGVGKSDASANTVTVDGDGAETVGADATVVLKYQDDSITMRADGSNWVKAGQVLSNQAVLDGINGLTEDTAPDRVADFLGSFDTSASIAKKVAFAKFGLVGITAITSTGTYDQTVNNPSSILAVAVGSGGGGGSTNAAGHGAGGGGGGGTSLALITRATLDANATLTATIGAAGAAGTSAGAGGTGGTTTFAGDVSGNWVSAAGGVGGAGTTGGEFNGGAGGVGTVGGLQFSGNAGGSGGGSDDAGGCGGATFLGGGGEGGGDAASAPGVVGGVYGGGGGGASGATNQVGGAGALGVVVIFEFA